VTGRPPLVYSPRGVDRSKLTTLSTSLPSDLVDRVKRRAESDHLTVDQLVTLALAVVLPGMIEDVIRRRVEHAVQSVQWPTRWVDETAEPPERTTTDVEITS